MPATDINDIRDRIGKMSYFDLNRAVAQVEDARQSARCNRDYQKIDACNDLLRDIEKLRHAPVQPCDANLPPNRQRPQQGPHEPVKVPAVVLAMRAKKLELGEQPQWEDPNGPTADPVGLEARVDLEAVEAAADPEPMPAPVFRTVKILKAHTVPQLREMCGAMKLSPGGNKGELIARLMDQ